MPEGLQLNHPWVVAVWPGMGNVALNAGVYLLAKLGMTGFAEFEAPDLFDIEHVEVKGGLIHPPRRPRNRFFAWKGAAEGHDLVVFLGEAQPPIGKYQLCRKITDYSRELGAERLFTFAAMATQMRPEHRARVFAAATDIDGLNELKRLELEVLEDGHIGGLNGLLLGAAGEAGLRGACLLGEMPHLFTQIPFPKASLAILEVFATIARLDLDLTELAEQAKAVEQQLEELLDRVESEIGPQQAANDEEAADSEPAEIEDPALVANRARIEKLFGAAVKDRTKSFELKQELDRLGLFKEYEDRFLDLFKRAE